jgi:hypothetical protein
MVGPGEGGSQRMEQYHICGTDPSRHSSTLEGFQTNRGGVDAPSAAFFYYEDTQSHQHHCQVALLDNVAGGRLRV